MVDGGNAGAIAGRAEIRPPGVRMLFMVIENFRDGDPVPVYRRVRDGGRLLPAGVRYLDSWVTTDLRRCYQVVDCAGRAELDQWMER